MREGKQNCPVCGTRVMPFDRYPDYVCGLCVESATNMEGDLVYFANQSISGGLVGYVKDSVTGEFVEDAALTTNPIVFIRGIECYAEEAKFGGIVIRPSGRR